MLNRIKTLDKRNLNILINVAMSFTIKGGSLFITLFTLPAYMKYFNNQAMLGVWFTLLSVLSWILFFDLGIGNGLRNKLVDILVSKNYKQAKEYISSAYIIITFFSVSVALLVYVISPYINWNHFFNISEEYISSRILLKTIRIVMLGILLQFVLRIITSILYALQHSFIPSLLNLITSVVLLLFVLNATSISAEYNIVILAYANVIAANLPLVVATIIIFMTKLRGCQPSIKMFNKQYAADIMKLGGVFFWLQIMAMILFNTNEYLITWFLTPSMVVEYQIYNKVFALGGSLVTLAMTPIWSAVTKAKVENDYKWIGRINKKLMMLGGLGITVEMMIVPFMQIVINVWLGDKAIKVNYFYAITFAIYGSVFLWSSVIASISNGLGELKIQFVFVTLGTLVNIPLSFIGAKLLNSYIAIVIANIISLLPFALYSHFGLVDLLIER